MYNGNIKSILHITIVLELMVSEHTILMFFLLSDDEIQVGGLQMLQPISWNDLESAPSQYPSGWALPPTTVSDCTYRARGTGKRTIIAMIS